MALEQPNEAVGAAADPTRDEERLVMARARRGERAAFGELVERHMRRAYRVGLGLLGSHEDALDLSQEAFARAFRARRKLDPERPFFPWYYQILRRLCFNFLRDRKLRRHKLDGAAPWLVEDAAHRAAARRPDRQAERAALRRRLQTAIEGLPEHQREIFVLRELEGLRYAEMAQLAEIPIGTVMSRLYAARRRLAAELETER